MGFVEKIPHYLIVFTQKKVIFRLPANGKIFVMN